MEQSETLVVQMVESWGFRLRYFSFTIFYFLFGVRESDRWIIGSDLARRRCETVGKRLQLVGLYMSS